MKNEKSQYRESVVWSNALSTNSQRESGHITYVTSNVIDDNMKEGCLHCIMLISFDINERRPESDSVSNAGISTLLVYVDLDPYDIL